ncbi:hypothetical protein [Sorangium sp. So ce854]|uniref:hypothetical protein n=1 Tax=Sorangium sp. So ce854 TaxID=3133322 RepID=UPI003F63D6D3
MVPRPAPLVNGRPYGPITGGSVCAMPLDHKAVVAEIDTILSRYTALQQGSKYSDLSDRPEDARKEVETLMFAAIKRLSPPESAYVSQATDVVKASKPQWTHVTLPQLHGILRALREDYVNGRTRAVAELIHADVFGDMLDMAQHLLDENYKDPAAVIAGSVLEEHLRKLCIKHAIPTVDAKGVHKKAAVMNSELRACGAYDKNDEKSVTAWLGTRNDAAHGNYAKYLAQQVNLLIASIRDFIARAPA